MGFGHTVLKMCSPELSLVLAKLCKLDGVHILIYPPFDFGY